MRKLIIGILVVALFAGGGYLAWRSAAPPAPEAAPTAPAVEAEPLLVAEARVVPVRSAALSLPTGGIVTEVLIQEGDQVAPSQLLVQLDQTHQQARVTNARAALVEAQTSYEKLLAGARAEEIAAAEAQLRQAQAQLRQATSSVAPEDLRAAEAQLEQARELLTRLQAGPKDTDQRALEAQLAQAQENLAMQRDQLSANKTSAQLQLEQATNALIQAQTSYSMAKWNWEEVQRTGRDPINPTVPDPANPARSKGNKLNDVEKQQYHDRFIQAEAALRSAEQAVQQAQVAYDTARQAEINGLQAAAQQVSQAQANLDKLMAGAGADELAAARAQLASAQANMTRLRGDERASTLDAAQAAVDAAQANLDRLRAPAPESELALARARIQSARAELDQAQLELTDTALRAPFAGTIAALDVKAREYVAAGTPIVRLADLSAWQIETTDLTELNIAQIRAGAQARLTFDALPGVELGGTVTRIRAFGENKQGDITYTVVVTPDQQDARLYWNMTATVAIIPQQTAARGL